MDYADDAVGDDAVGGYKVNLKNVIPNKLKCIICSLLMRGAIRTSRGKMACKSCFLKAKGDSQICPIDNEPITDDEFLEDNHTCQEISQLECYCTNQYKGCKWEGVVDNFQVHKRNCKHERKKDMTQLKDITRMNEVKESIDRTVLKDNENCLQEINTKLSEPGHVEVEEELKNDTEVAPYLHKRGGSRSCSRLYRIGNKFAIFIKQPAKNIIIDLGCPFYFTQLYAIMRNHILNQKSYVETTVNTLCNANEEGISEIHESIQNNDQTILTQHSNLSRILKTFDNIELCHKIIINTYIYYYKLLSQIIITNLRYFEMVHFISSIASSTITSEKHQIFKPKYEFGCDDKEFKCETFILNHIPSNPSISIPVELLLRNLTDITWFLGKGSFGDVYGYKDKNINCSVAIKKISIPINGVMKEANDVRKEVEMLMKLKHENIVQYVGSYEINNNLFIVLEYMDKGSLRGKLNELKQSQAPVTNQPVLPYDEIIKYTHEIVVGLVYLHSNKLIHRDLRSANVLLSAAGTAKIADFGIYKDLSRLCIHSGFSTTVDNAHWCSPEFIKQEKEKIGCKVDVWSLGVTILEMIHVVPPFIERNFEHVAYMFALCVRKELPDIPHFVREDIKAILHRCLVFEADERPHSKDLLD